MSSRNLVFLYLQRVRTHPLQELLAMLGIAVGVALVFAVQVANTSVVGSVEQLVQGITGRAQLQVAARDPDGFDARLTPAIARLPDVRAVAPIVNRRVELRGPHGATTVSLIGGDRRFVDLGGSLLRTFVASRLPLQHAVALPRPLVRTLGTRLGGVVTLASGSNTSRVTVGAVLTRDDIGALADSPIALAPLPYAQRIARMPGRVSTVLVVARAHRTARARAELRRIAGARLNVDDSDVEARRLRQASTPNDQSTALFAAISALVGLLFAFNAMLLTVPERRRFIADLRLEGLGDLTAVRLVLFDAIVLGVSASALGLLLGDALSRHEFRAVPGYLSFAFSIGDQRIVEPQSVVLAIAGGMGATLLAALRPLSDLLSRRPLDDVYREDDDRGEGALLARRWIALCGLLLVVAAVLVLALSPAATVGGIVLLLGGMLLLLPALLGVALRVLETTSHRLRSAVFVVALGELRTTTTRSLALAATGALAVFGSVAVEGAHADLQRGLDLGAHQVSVKADLWVMPGDDANVLATELFHPPRRLAALAALPGVRAVRSYRGAFLDMGDRRVWVVAPPSSDRRPLLPVHLWRGDFATATAHLRGHGWVALSGALASRAHVHIGQTVTLPTPRPVRLRVTALLTNMGWSSGALIMNGSDFRRAWASDAVGALAVSVAPDASRAAVAQRLRAALQPDTSLAVRSAAQREQSFRTKARQGLSRLTQIATLVLVAAALALAAAMGGVVWNRRPRLITLKLTGFSEGELWRALVLEAAIVLGIGCSVGALFGLWGQFMLTRWLSISTGFPTSYAPALTLALSTFAAVTVVAITAAAVPGFAAARVTPTPSAAGQ
jgi:putative ABC transport system permease protein